MKIIAITNPYSIKFEESIINRLFSEGLTSLHIRKPEFSKQDYISFITNIDEKYHDRIVLHQYYSLTKVFNIHSIHIPYDELKSKVSSFIINTFAISHDKKIHKVTTLSHYKSLLGNLGGADEAFLGPIFSKAAADIANPVMNIDRLTIALAKCDKPVAALGGVSINTIDALLNIGFERVVLQSAIWKTIDPVAEFIKLRDYQTPERQYYKLSVV
jgi:thiamine-phosphate pyrophosphorylase